MDEKRPQLWINLGMTMLFIFHRDPSGTVESLDMLRRGDKWESWKLGHSFSEQEIINIRNDGWHLLEEL